MKTTKPEHWTYDEWKDAMRKVIELGYKKNAHWKAFYMCDKWDKYISLPLVLTSSILSTLSISQTASTSNIQSITINYLITVSSLFVTGLTTVGKFYSYAELKEGHRQACFNYLRLRSELILQLNDSNIDYSNFMKTYHTKWLNIRENSPNLPLSVVKEMTDKTNKIETEYLENIVYNNRLEDKNKNIEHINSDDNESLNEVKIDEKT
jgi:hypothetical protein